MQDKIPYCCLTCYSECIKLIDSLFYHTVFLLFWKERHVGFCPTPEGFCPRGFCRGGFCPDTEETTLVQTVTVSEFIYFTRVSTWLGAVVRAMDSWDRYYQCENTCTFTYLHARVCGSSRVLYTLSLSHSLTHSPTHYCAWPAQDRNSLHSE